MKNILKLIVCSAIIALAPLSANAQSTKKLAGDVDGDKIVTIADLPYLIDVLNGKKTSENADVDGSGKVNAGDVNELVRILLDPNSVRELEEETLPDMLISEKPVSTLEAGKEYILMNNSSSMYLRNDGGLYISSSTPLKYGTPEFFEGYLFSLKADGSFAQNYGKANNYAFDYSVDNGNDPDDVILLSKQRAASTVSYFKVYDSANQSLLVKNNTLYGTKEATTDVTSNWVVYEAKHVDHLYDNGACVYCGIDAPYCTITVEGDDVVGSVSGGGQYKIGTTATISAKVTNPYYEFVKWSDGDTNASRQIKVLSDSTFEAIYQPKKYKLAVKVDADCSTMGSVTGSGVYEAGTKARITANSASGYRFVQWNDGNTESTRDVLVDKDQQVFTAKFAKLYTVIAYSTGPGYVNQSMSYINGKQYVTLTAIEIPGKNSVFSHWSNGSTDPEITFEVTEDNILIYATFVKQ